MFKLAVGQLWQHRVLWTSVALTIASVALFISLCINFMVSVAAADPAVFTQPGIQSGGRDSYLEIGTNLLVYSGLPSIVVLAVVLANVSVQLRSAHASWMLAGAGSGQVLLIFVFQTLLVSIFGAASGVMISLLLQSRVNHLLFGWNRTHDAVLPTQYSAVAPLFTLVVTATLSCVSAFAPVLQIRRVSPLLVFNDSQVGGARPVRRRLVVPLIFVATVLLPLTATLLVVPSLPEPIYAVLATLPMGQALVIATALFAPVLVPPLMRFWTDIPVLRDWVPWHIGRRVAAARAESSSATVAPLMVGVGVFVSFTMVGRTGGRITEPGQVNLFDGTLMLTPLAVVAAVGTISVIFMSTRQRGLDVVTMRTASATRQDVILALLCEGVIYVLTTLLLVLIPTAAQALLLGFALGSHGLSPMSLSVDLLAPGIVYALGASGIIATVVLTGQRFWSLPVRSVVARINA